MKDCHISLVLLTGLYVPVAKVFPAFSSTPFNSDISLEIECVHEAVSRIDQWSKTMAEGILVDIHHQGEARGEKLQAEVNATRKTAVATLLGTQSLEGQLSQVEDIVQTIPEGLQSLKHDLSDIKRHLTMTELVTINVMNNTRNGYGVSAQNWMLPMLRDIACYMDKSTQQRKLQLLHDEVNQRRIEVGAKMTQSIDAPQTLRLSAGELLAILSVRLEVVTRDFACVVQQGLRFTPAQQGQAQWLFRNARFRQWLSSPSSDLVLVHESSIDAYSSPLRISSLSVVCATVASSIIPRTDGTAISLYFFCGMHTVSVDGLNGPQGLVRSLIARLVVELEARYEAPANLAFIDEQFAEALGHRDVRALCAVLRSILTQFPHNMTVFCMLDGITWYERTEFLEDLFKVIQRLSDMVDGDQSGPNLKILLTSPFRSRHVALVMPTDRQIVLQPEANMLVEPSERMLFSQLGRGIDRVLDSSAVSARRRFRHE